jgi:hypothetical protein
MYDLEGTDSNREWIEVHNNTDNTLDLSTYYLFENNVSHGISGEDTVLAGEFAVIVDSVDKFLEDFPGYSGKLFDSVFSLSNSGEELILQNPNKETVDNLSYSPDLGAKGTGNSLQYFEGVLIPGDPTPGAQNVTEPEDESEPNEPVDNSGSSGNSNNSSHTGQNEISDYSPKPKVKTGIGRNRTVSINTPIEFEVYLSGEERGRYFWNFGDGNSEKGKTVDNIYKYPGEYNVVMNAYFGRYKTTSRIKVTVFEPSLDISMDNNSIEINNTGKSEVNIGDFTLKTKDKKIKILKDTIISKGHSIHFDYKEEPINIVFQYPNGKDYFSESLDKAKQYCTELKKRNLFCDIKEAQKLFDSI